MTRRNAAGPTIVESSMWLRIPGCPKLCLSAADAGLGFHLLLPLPIMALASRAPASLRMGLALHAQQIRSIVSVELPPLPYEYR